jgi:hypothetical protein
MECAHIIISSSNCCSLVIISSSIYKPDPFLTANSNLAMNLQLPLLGMASPQLLVIMNDTLLVLAVVNLTDDVDVFNNGSDFA